ncbi:3207_t:CDS:2 [Cetraspora pellucida]|uniref:3207_t:CDS:1 n=1 Tax=Cetraspora pellucida TaxID=1433469 RepID=A0A9N9A5T3_9GLOM|nr:3207_t:CDS:2 [Cetraspora pellucida]
MNPTVYTVEKPGGDPVNQCSIMYTITRPGAPATEDPPHGSAVNDYLEILSF